MTSKGNSHAHGASNWQGNSFANGPAINGGMNWEQAELMASQPNQFRDGQ